MTAELDKARRDLQASFNLGRLVLRGAEFAANIEALVRAILAEQDGGKDKPSSRTGREPSLASEIVSVAAENTEHFERWMEAHGHERMTCPAPTPKRYLVGEHGAVEDIGGVWMDASEVDEVLRSERAAREQAEQRVAQLERDVDALSKGRIITPSLAEARKWNKIAMEQVAVRNPKPEPTEGVERGSTGSEDKPATDAQRARSNPGGSSSAATLEPGPVVSTPTSLPARDGDEPPASVYYPTVIEYPDSGRAEFVLRDGLNVYDKGEHYDIIRDGETQEVIGFAWPLGTNPALAPARAAGIKGSADDA